MARQEVHLPIWNRVALCSNRVQSDRRDVDGPWLSVQAEGRDPVAAGVLEIVGLLRSGRSVAACLQGLARVFGMAVGGSAATVSLLTGNETCEQTWTLDGEARGRELPDLRWVFDVQLAGGATLHVCVSDVEQVDEARAVVDGLAEAAVLAASMAVESAAIRARAGRFHVCVRDDEL
jgi:hypothetical protein